MSWLEHYPRLINGGYVLRMSWVENCLKINFLKIYWRPESKCSAKFNSKKIYSLRRLYSYHNKFCTAEYNKALVTKF